MLQEGAVYCCMCGTRCLEASSPLATTSAGSSISPSNNRVTRFGAGTAVEYYSTTLGGWTPAIVQGFDEAGGHYQLDIQPMALPTKVRAPPGSPAAAAIFATAVPTPSNLAGEVPSFGASAPSQLLVAAPAAPAAANPPMASTLETWAANAAAAAAGWFSKPGASPAAAGTTEYPSPSKRPPLQRLSGDVDGTPESEEEIVRRLTSMGFGEEAAQRAAKRNPTAEDAKQWLLESA